MRASKFTLILLLALLLTTSINCKNKPDELEKAEQSNAEEPGTRFAINDTYDSVRQGVRLILTFDSTTSSFIGTVENVTEEPVKLVRIEVHLSNGIELGPIERINLEPGNKENVRLVAEGQKFEWWKAHPEAGEGEHETGHEGDHEHEHGEEHEHGRQH
jgi:hypothetical protein